MMGESRSDKISALRARIEHAERERDAWRGNGSRHNHEMACVLVDALKKELAALEWTGSGSRG